MISRATCANLLKFVQPEDVGRIHKEKIE